MAMAGEPKKKKWRNNRPRKVGPWPPPLPDDMDLGEALETYELVSREVTRLLDSANGRCLSRLLAPSTIAIKLRLPKSRVVAAVEHLEGRRFATFTRRRLMDKACELLVEGRCVEEAIDLLGFHGLPFQFYHMFTSRMKELIGVYLRPGEFQRMVRAGQSDPFAPVLKRKYEIGTGCRAAALAQAARRREQKLGLATEAPKKERRKKCQQ